jgi:hypothetical protein
MVDTVEIRLGSVQKIRYSINHLFNQPSMKQSNKSMTRVSPKGNLKPNFRYQTSVGLYVEYFKVGQDTCIKYVNFDPSMLEADTENVAQNSDTENVAQNSDTENVAQNSDTENVAQNSDTENVAQNSDTENVFAYKPRYTVTHDRKRDLWVLRIKRQRGGNYNMVSRHKTKAEAVAALLKLEAA